MSSPFVKWYLYLAVIILCVTAAAKTFSAFGQAGILGSEDPIFGIPIRVMLTVAAGIEMAVVSACLIVPSMRLKAALLAWLGTTFLIYRLGLWFVGYHEPCPCLGSITQRLGLPNRVADVALKMIITYLICGGYSILWEIQEAKAGRTPVMV